MPIFAPLPYCKRNQGVPPGNGAGEESKYALRVCPTVGQRKSENQVDEFLYFDYNQKSTSLLVAAFFALIFSVLVLVAGLRENKKEAYWLAMFIFLGGLYLCPFLLGYGGWYSIRSYREFLFFVPFQQLLLIGPVFFFYGKNLLTGRAIQSPCDYLHFLPAALYLLYSLVVFITDKLILSEFYFYADGRDKDLAFWYQFAGLVSMLVYLLLSLRRYRRYRRAALREVSFADEIAFTWVRNFALAFGLILVLRVLFFVINPEWGNFGGKYWYYLCFSVLLIYISVAGYTTTIRTTLLHRSGLRLAIGAHDTKPVSISPTISPSWKERIILTIEVANLYQDPTLTLTDLANHLGTNRNVVSRAINQEFGLNFNDFINQRRVEAVIARLRAGEHEQSTLLGIALDCGFNSKTTFNRAFKRHTKLTPRQFIAKNLA